MKMRDPNRIPIFCYYLTQLWEKYPDLRFAQIVELIKSDYFLKEKNFFYWEDDEVLTIIKRLNDFNSSYIGCSDKEEITNTIEPHQMSIFDIYKNLNIKPKELEIHLGESKNE